MSNVFVSYLDYIQDPKLLKKSSEVFIPAYSGTTKWPENTQGTATFTKKTSSNNKVNKK